MSINIYGAGIAGLSLAASLSANRFENYKIFEKASEIRKSDTAVQLGFNSFKALIKDISGFDIFIVGNPSSSMILLNKLEAEVEIFSAASSLLHNFVTSFAKIILASFNSTPFNCCNLLISVIGISVNSFKNFITSKSSVFLQYSLQLSYQH